MYARQEVWRVWQLQGRRCNLCKRKIPFDLMHGDHIIPWSQGGNTDLCNLQALCGSCNLRKGTRSQDTAAAYFDVDRISRGMASLRTWQQQALPVVLERILTQPVLVEACPGAGKTIFGLEVAYRLVAQRRISRVLVVVPTIGIADNWSQVASQADTRAPTLPLHTQRDWKPVDPIGDRWLGAVVTYQSLFAASEMFLAHVTDPGQRTLVIFDEVHHAGVGKAWGQAAQEAFANHAAAILSLSGTPFRTDLEPIVFVPSEGGSAKPHYTYSYDQAIRDGACRPVQFVEATGRTTFRTRDGLTHTVSFDDSDLTDAGERWRLRSALEWIDEGSIAAKMLSDANDYLLALRKQGDGDAGGLVVCVDCQHASAVAEHMANSFLNRRPIVACSRLHDANDPQPANAIRRYSASHAPWIVAVNMVSEGIDISRLRAVVYLTNRLTLLSFRQIVGRVVRSDRANRDDHGRVYIPADPRLVAMAREITSEADLLPPPMRIIVDGSGAGVTSVYGEASGLGEPFAVVDTVGEQGAAFDTQGREADRLLVMCARLFIQRQGLTDTDPESLALAAGEVPALKAELLALRSLV